MAKIYLKSDKTEFFPTPKKVRDDLYSMIPDSVHYILDPCCGEGALEIDDDRYDYTLFDLVDRSGGKFHVNIGDFLKQPVCLAPDGEKFDAVVMNPPFGLTEEFIQKAFKFSDDIFIIAPFKTVLKNHKTEAVDLVTDWHYPIMFGGIRVAIGCMWLHRNGGLKLNGKGSLYDQIMRDKYPKSQTFAATFKEVEEPPEDKWFIVNRVTMSRVERGHQLIQDKDIYEPGDENAFIAISSNINTKKGDKIPRRIMTFDSYEKAKAFQKKYDDNDDFIRNYIYMHASQILKLDQIPLL